MQLQRVDVTRSAIRPPWAVMAAPLSQLSSNGLTLVRLAPSPAPHFASFAPHVAPRSRRVSPHPHAAPTAPRAADALAPPRSSQRAERSPSLDKSVPSSPGLAPNGLYYRTALHESSALNSYSALLSDVFTRFEAERATRRE